MANTVDEGSSSGAGVNTGVSGSESGGAGSVASFAVGPGASGTGSLAEVALRAGSGGTGAVADSVVSELTGGAVDGSSDADAVVEVVASVTGVAEGVGQA